MPSQDSPLAATGATELPEISAEKLEEESLQAAMNNADGSTAATRRIERMIESTQGTQNRRRVRVVHAVVDRTDERRAVHLLGQARQVFAELHARHRRGDRSKRAADLGRGRGLHVPHVEVTWPAVEEHEDAGVGRRG